MTDRYAVIGNPIGFTKSPFIHCTFAEATGQDLSYEAIEGPIGGFAGRVDQFRAEGARGLNITAPFKLDAFAYATELSDSARQAGAANCLKFEGDRIIAENFDGVGLVRDITVNLGVKMKGRRVLMLGAGGAARGALLPFLRQQPAELVLVNRTLSKAVVLAEEFAGRGPLIVSGYGELVDLAEGYDVVINATSASLRGEMPPLPSHVLRGAELAYELAYGKGLTPFLQAARAAGVAKLADGVGMLVEQAAEAFVWWRGVRPSTAEVIAKLTVPLT
ncbi:dehydroshikimate reductase, NAD(P)-binding [Bradyrhizobium sp. ORS 285]|uniref:shikimate dehydrogenase n=1 Tax=Bradyrhizobium sp. ORS 285 TaxID=115808 RepID=UPI000240625A|nr:shikimate dehydrogenase [Bradyrhizobium sp. ORS 285]CCD88909.1 dehydroshikimate reductase, NAD(P)-binding [Bradyrhizobium sp. ORS 285]SMX58054.1 dehydroshikimate reductase, NAD(P)-binding [Bradyrhizobium sp. ORS 285]